MNHVGLPKHLYPSRKRTSSFAREYYGPLHAHDDPGVFSHGISAMAHDPYSIASEGASPEPGVAVESYTDEGDSEMTLPGKEGSEGVTGSATNAYDLDGVPDPVGGYQFHRIKRGDNLHSLSLKYDCSVNRLRQLNREACFGGKLTHMNGQLLVIPLSKYAREVHSEGVVGGSDDPDHTGTDKIQAPLTYDCVIKDGKIKSEIDLKIKTILAKDKAQLMDRLRAKKMLRTKLDDAGMYELRKTFRHFASDVEVPRIDFYLAEAHWDVREGLKLYQSDIRWEKQHTMKARTGLSIGECKELLEAHDWNVEDAITAHRRSLRRKGKSGGLFGFGGGSSSDIRSVQEPLLLGVNNNYNSNSDVNSQQNQQRSDRLDVVDPPNIEDTGCCFPF